MRALHESWSEVLISESIFAKPHCLIFFPGTRPEMYTKAVASSAEHVCMDLEDAVASESKAEARAAAEVLLQKTDLDLTRFVLRINPPNSAEGDLDREMLERVAPKAAIKLMIPKVDCSDELESFQQSLKEIHVFATFIAVVESALGVDRAKAIAASPSVSGLLFGGLDLSVELGIPLDWEALLYARSRVVLAAQMNGIKAIDMPYLRVADLEGLQKESEAAHRLGFVGKAVIHPKHVTTVHEVFSPSDSEIARARRVTETFEHEQDGVFILDGVMVDRPEIKAAMSIAAWADEHGR